MLGVVVILLQLALFVWLIGALVFMGLGLGTVLDEWDSHRKYYSHKQQLADVFALAALWPVCVAWWLE